MLTAYTLPVLSDFDHTRLRLLLRALASGTPRRRESAERLRRKIERAVVVPPSSVTPDVVTLYSVVRFRELAARDEHTLRLVFPGETREHEDNVSVLAPVGIALLGERTGTTVSCETPQGDVRLRILRVVYQPEAAGAYYV
jgi:regulator of nucleoside diphosphate kinase